MYHERIVESIEKTYEPDKNYVMITADTAADIPNPAEHPEWEVGSELVVLENGGSKYRLSNAREWVAVNFNSGGGGAEVFVCYIESRGDEMRADKTEAELREAYASGKIVKVYYKGAECLRLYNVAYNTEDPLIFVYFGCTVFAGGSAPTKISAGCFIFKDGMITVTTPTIGS